MIAAFRRAGRFFANVGAAALRVPFLGATLRVAGRTVTGYARDSCGTHAAAIAFYSILSLIPFVLLMLAVLGHVASPDTEMYRDVVAAAKTHFPDVERALALLTEKRGSFFLFGVVSLLLTAGLVFEALDTALNRIFPPHTVRHLVIMKLVAALAFLIVASTGLLATYAMSLARTWLAARGFSLRAALDSDAAWVHVGAMAFIVLLFVATVKYFTGRRVPTRYAFAGGGLFVLLWYAARTLFGWYLSSVASYSIVYGSLATLVVLVLWVFYGSCVFLLSAEFVKALMTQAAAMHKWQ